MSRSSSAGRTAALSMFVAILVTGLRASVLASGVAMGTPMTYTTNQELPEVLDRIAAGSKGLIKITALPGDEDGGNLPVAVAGSGRPEDPAVLVVAGLDGRHLLGTELALASLRSISADPEAARALLSDRTLYVIPRVNFEGATASWGRPGRAQAGLNGQADVDRDGLVGEDPADDLDGDGVITVTCVRDPEGEWLRLPEHPDFFRRADPSKGEAGEWRILVEGRDDDGDRRWNEEEDGGVRLAHNFAVQYPWFQRGSGRHQVSEAQTRALAHFLSQHRNIGAVLVYGFEDNLLTLLPEGKTSDPDPAASRWNRQPLTHPQKNDLPLLQEIARQYRESLGLEGNSKRLGFGGFGAELEPEELGGVPNPEKAAEGGLATFVYYARGRLALGTPGWTPALQMARIEAAQEKGKPQSGTDADSTDGSDSEGAAPQKIDADAPESGAIEGENADPGKVERAEESAEGIGSVPEAMNATGPQGAPSPREPREKEKEKESSLLEEAKFRDWLVEQRPGAWLGWSTFRHPDFPDAEALVGGYTVLARINPPSAIVDSIAPVHVALVDRLLNQLPRVRIREAELQSLGNGLHELRFTVENTGYLPDRLAQGRYSAEVHATRFQLGVPPGGSVLGASDRGPIETLEGSGGSREIRRLLRLPTGGRVSIEVISELAGRDTRTIEAGARWQAPQGTGGSR